MNYKPGTLVQIIAATHEKQHIGKIVRCVHFDGEGWYVEPGLQHATPPWAGQECRWYEAHLRPIRDPGEDAVDEIVAKVGKPDSAAIEWALQVPVA